MDGEFAARWIADWNSHNLDAILAHYAEGICFRSPFAEQLVGSGQIEGRVALRSYWAIGLKRRPLLHFALIDCYQGFSTRALHYRNETGPWLVVWPGKRSGESDFLAKRSFR